jgi:exopolysaccharide production repressor protein
MSFPKFLMGMLGVLIAFAVTTYMMTQSFWATLIETLICAVLIQVGYFGVILLLVKREKDGAAETQKPAPLDEASAKKSPPPFKTSATKAP